MTTEEITFVQNQVYTQIFLDEFKKQRKASAIQPSDSLIDKYDIDKQTSGKLK